MTLGNWVSAATAALATAGVESARLEAQLLAAHALCEERTWVLTHADAIVPEHILDPLLARRVGREPLAYILGYREFYGRRFLVNPSVLIPRQETETLVETALSLPDGPLTVLDLGTGSGVLAVTLKLERPSWSVTALDVSLEALMVAQQNAESWGATIRFRLSDAFAALGQERFDLIVTNPPYIGTSEPLMPEVASFEPHLALFAGALGLTFYERLAMEGREHLTPRGRMMMEVGFTQAAQVKGLFVESGWTHEATVPDLSGTPRVVVVAALP